MFQGLKELTAAKGRTLLITVTVGLIAVLVTFLSALTAGLGHQSVSALKELAGENQLILADSGSTTLSASTLSEMAVSQLEAEGAQMLWQVRDRVSDTPVMLLNSPDLAPGEISLPADLDETSTATQFHATSVVDSPNDLYLDHLPVVLMNTSDLSQLAGIRGMQGPAGAFLTTDTAELPADTVALTGSERWNASASYQGEQMSLNLMIIMLYVISALVLGAFFTVWTIQRLRGIAISSALGAARRVLIADALGQAVIVLAFGITAGTLITVVSALGMGDAMPVVIDATTTMYPALILAAAGLLGATISLAPILRVEPRSALITA
ncbi:FtsX-like permease family protein [Corynebacterium crudilactis]|uniref:ABC transporter permease n=1 Tax=Corynebacterium crudilactis TaxID=1652495 RepID=A0A172QXB4_9CORY|nr:ABC transporter permease [Corynebacterium crudilactis]ANE05352.1 ABC transporter permease [Corynebacterium crudilactis]